MLNKPEQQLALIVFLIIGGAIASGGFLVYNLIKWIF